MRIIKHDFKNEEKKLKTHHKEKEMFDKIILLFKECQTFDDLCNNPFFYLYRFEKLKYEMNGYYACNLQKSGGVIRLIFKIDKIKNEVELVFITMNHYEDFKRKLKEGVLV